MRYNKDFIQLDRVLKSVLLKYDLDGLREHDKVWPNWPDLVGPELSKYFVPKYLCQGVLYVETTGISGERERNSKKKKLLSILARNQDTVSVQDVKFI
jgi:hypothetical protein